MKKWSFQPFSVRCLVKETIGWYISMKSRRIVHNICRSHNSECSHNFVSATHEVPDHHLLHEQQWWAAMTPHWLDQLLTVGVDKYTKLWANHYTNSHVLSFCCISIINGKTRSWCWLALKRHAVLDILDSTCEQIQSLTCLKMVLLPEPS